jgi:hypothetical protein
MWGSADWLRLRRPLVARAFACIDSSYRHKRATVVAFYFPAAQRGPKVLRVDTAAFNSTMLGLYSAFLKSRILEWGSGRCVDRRLISEVEARG